MSTYIATKVGMFLFPVRLAPLEKHGVKHMKHTIIIAALAAALFSSTNPAHASSLRVPYQMRWDAFNLVGNNLRLGYYNSSGSFCRLS